MTVIVIPILSKLLKDQINEEEYVYFCQKKRESNRPIT